MRYRQSILVSCVVPWDERYCLLEQAFRDQVRYFVDRGFADLYIFGTAGEGHAVDTARFRQVAEVFWDETSRPGVSAMVGVIGLSTANIMERIGIAYGLGFRTFQISLPCWGALNDEELLRFFSDVCTAWPDCRFLHYNLPRSRRMLAPADYRRLAAAVPNLVATKNTGLNVAATGELVRTVPEMQHFLGEAMFPTGCTAGECSLLSSFAGFAPARIRRYFEHGRAGRFDELFRMQSELLAVVADLEAPTRGQDADGRRLRQDVGAAGRTGDAASSPLALPEFFRGRLPPVPRRSSTEVSGMGGRQPAPRRRRRLSHMTHRERISSAIAYRPPDRLPANESFWDGTIDDWKEQGMPAGTAPIDYFDLDVCFMHLDTSFQLPQKLLRREGPYIVYEDRYGYTVKKLDNRSGTLGFISHVTGDRNIWDKLKHRLALSSDPHAPARIDSVSYFGRFCPSPTWQEAREKYRRLYDSGRYLVFSAYGPLEGTWRHRGFENLLMDVKVEPEWLTEMAGVYIDLVIAILRRCLENGMKPDGYFMVEDIAHATGMLLSPKCWRKIFQPAVARLGTFLKQHDIDFWMHSDGNPEPIFADLIDCGVKVMHPLEAPAGLDIAKLHPKYAGRLAFCGNISVRKMLGPREGLEEEIRLKVPFAREGGYILHSDHSIPPQVSFDRYEWLLATARRCFGASA